MNRKKLVEALDIVSRGLDNNNVIPVYNYLCFTGTKVFTFNDVFGIIAETEVMPSFGCHGPTLLGLLKSSYAEEVKFEVESDSVRVYTGNSEFNLPYIKPEQFIWTEPTELPQFEYELGKVIEGIETCLLTCSTDTSLGVFNQVCLKGSKGRMTIYSTDGDAVTQYLTELKCPDFEAESTPRQLCAEIVKLYEPSDLVSSNENPNGRLVFTENWVYAEVAPEVKIYGKRLDKPSFDYEAEMQKLLNKNKQGDWDYIPEGFDEALSRARVVGDPETTPTLLSVDGGLLAFITETQLGNVLDGVEVDPAKTPNIEIKVNAELVQKNIKDCEQFWLSQACVFLKNDRILRVVANMS